jgi:DnaJ-class molecular chaperone
MLILNLTAYNAKQNGADALDYFKALEESGYTITDTEKTALAELRELIKCPECEGDGRPFAKDGSRNGNAKCPACEGRGVVSE